MGEPTGSGKFSWEGIQLMWVVLGFIGAALGNTIAAADAEPASSQEALDVAAAKAYAKLTALRAMTPAQVQAWVDANVIDLASARDAIKTLAIAVGILARRI